MIDEATQELLSRHLDGDLEPGERRLLEARLEAEPSLAAELADLGRLRDGLRALAARDEPPANLDAAVEPLRRSAPPTPVLRPAYRWLALAATLLIGATVTLRVAQRASTPLAPAPAPARGLRDAPYQLRPLPTSSVPEDEELIGAADHLLASPPPTPVLPEPSVHTAVGPLNESERQLTAQAEDASKRERCDPDRVVAQARALPPAEAPVDDDLPGGAGKRAAAAGVSTAPATREGTEAKASLQPAPAPSAGGAELRSQEVAPRQGTLTLSTDRGQVEIRFATHVVDGVRDLTVQVSVRAGVIVAVRSPSTHEAPPLPDTLVNELTGLAAEAVADGDYAAAIRVP